ncbi:MAG: Holliday junction resolvase RecU [Parcubacteria group bacterium]|jgi:penicillin-binding protein-related factor A (putative recombinase)
MTAPTPRRKRPVKPEAEKAADRLRRQQVKKRGERWQDMLAAGFEALTAPHDIDKVEPPVKIIRPLGAGRYEVVFTRSGDADFRGGYRGIITAVEAKDTAADQLELREIDDAQSDALARVHRQGGIALVAVRFGDESACRAWALPWATVAAMRAAGKRVVTERELAAGEFEAYLIRVCVFCGDRVALLDQLMEESLFNLPSAVREMAGRG